MPEATTDQMVIVKTPGIIKEPNISATNIYLKRLHDAIPDLKVLLIVKNPIDRVVSHIVHHYVQGPYKDEDMPDIDDIIMGRAGHIPGEYRISHNRAAD